MELYKSKYSDKKDSRRTSKRENNPSRSFRNSSNDRSSRYSRDDKRGESTTVTCADCGTECQIPFVPRTNKPVYCSDCFRQNKPQDSNNDRYSRDDRSSRSYNHQEFTRTDSRSKKSKGDKFLKKQESFYSGGSEKFYATLKEKLFEILGGKSCSSCGFKDERALGISHIFDDSPDSLGRGGAASSWGKYISEPELAKKDLRVLCLNCNEIRQPVSKPKENSSKSKPKKSRYFPR
ncbi:hypothetical protein NZNM25_11470 [Nitrosopumilus zosterae]|uniref:CxxC-x17-CxxC domain-containing protein n=1 Tax=Nitrosopumilus zosterae TaxID=718286 RepID=A0A2S2KRS2_9ARCH|nr:CxxC-x17-CxxC domain-containing protein [Nitrosopumilus zosterae]BDQ30204.1 hypothetical protein NZOSNM25_000303 [Nitrosopumilus zosterae]GBH34356.1 hypothetical protein NZNM25_11470 [Nitrosopumilus zosterae]